MKQFGSRTTIAQDIWRHVGLGRLTLVDDKDNNLLPEISLGELPEDTTEDQKNGLLLEKYFGTVLDTFARQLGLIEVEDGEEVLNSTAQAIVDSWETSMQGVKIKDQNSVENPIKLFMENLIDGKVSDDANVDKKLAHLIHGINQVSIVNPTLSVMNCIKSKDPDHFGKILKGVSGGRSIQYEIAEDKVAITYKERLINPDFPVPPGKFNDFITTCKYQVVVTNVLTSSLSNLDEWKSQVSVAVNNPPGMEDAMEIHLIKKVLKLAGYTVNEGLCDKFAKV